MKVEVELPPGVYPTDAEVQELLRKFQEIKAVTFKRRLCSMLLGHIRAAKSDEGKADIAADAALMAFRSLIESTRDSFDVSPHSKESVYLGNFKEALLQRLK